MPATQKTWVQSLAQEDHLEKGIVTHSSILAWKFLVHILLKPSLKNFEHYLVSM